MLNQEDMDAHTHAPAHRAAYPPRGLAAASLGLSDSSVEEEHHPDNYDVVDDQQPVQWKVSPLYENSPAGRSAAAGGGHLQHHLSPPSALKAFSPGHKPLKSPSSRHKPHAARALYAPSTRDQAAEPAQDDRAAQQQARLPAAPLAAGLAKTRSELFSPSKKSKRVLRPAAGES